MKESSAVVNSSIQVFGIIGTNTFGIAWTIYPAMVLICILIGAQTLAAAYYFNTKELPDRSEYNKNSASKIFSIMVGIMYVITSYQIYLLGFEFFAGLAFGHAIIVLFASIMKKEVEE